MWSTRTLDFSLSTVQGFSSESDFEDYVEQENNSRRVLIAFIFDHEFKNSHDPLPLKVRTFCVETSSLYFSFPEISWSRGVMIPFYKWGDCHLPKVRLLVRSSAGMQTQIPCAWVPVHLFSPCFVLMGKELNSLLPALLCVSENPRKHWWLRVTFAAASGMAAVSSCARDAMVS